MGNKAVFVLGIAANVLLVMSFMFAVYFILTMKVPGGIGIDPQPDPSRWLIALLTVMGGAVQWAFTMGFAHLVDNSIKIEKRFDSLANDVNKIKEKVRGI
ncbi:hypothetical protein [Fictibacillus arsenicus]|uniref:Uncharacterized protein n=1 Tax=Fictibacillus arsenicus TaxID=255247 RepID=A0A1V3GBF9_9BACL|nr:hypothetical protein [Fictibacillus arsenicus]OOE14042.1 hypothetical protein UN64_02175 [Fictibacillus arsenicus]